MRKSHVKVIVNPLGAPCFSTSPSGISGPVDLLVAGDLHLRDDQPPARTDDFPATVRRKLEWIAETAEQIAKEQGGVVPTLLLPGDLFHRATMNPYLIGLALGVFRRFVYVAAVPGQHDLPQHSMALYPRSCLHALEEAEAVTVIRAGEQIGQIGINGAWHITGWGWDRGDDTKPPPTTEPGFNILLTHTLIRTSGDGLPKDMGGEPVSPYRSAAHSAGYDLVVSGDNHHGFICKGNHSEAALINCGSMTRMTAAQTEHHPFIVAVQFHPLRITPIYFPIDPGAVSRDRVEAEAEREQRVTAFVDQLRGDSEMGLDFELNLKTYLRANRGAITPETRELIQRAMEEAQGV